MRSITIDLFDGRPSPEARSWDLPPWGHPLGRAVLPLFIRAENRLIPAGSAFWVGRAPSFAVTAMHNVAEALKLDGRFDQALSRGALPTEGELRNVGLYVLHTEAVSAAGGRATFVPFENVHGGPPGDVGFGFPMADPARATVSMPLSFDPPRIGETVYCVGYRNSEPREGLPFDDVMAGRFNLDRYRHQLTVVEGVVQRIFVQRFARGFLEGPCFLIDQTIDHGLSGGPVITADGRIVGINSAGAETYLGGPAALASMLYPLLMTPLKWGFQFGPVRMNQRTPLADLVGRGIIASDGSETHVTLRPVVEQNGWAIGPRIPKSDHDFVHDDFAAYQAGVPSQPVGGEFYRLVQPAPEAPEEAGKTESGAEEVDPAN